MNELYSKLKPACFTIAFTWLWISNLYCQQLPLFTQYREYHGYINPGSIPYDYYIYQYNFQAGLSYRTQWQGVEGAPSTQVLQASYIFDEGDVGLLTGATIINDRTGPLGLTGINFRTSAILGRDPDHGFISIGLSFGINQYRIKTGDLVATHPDEIFDRDLSTQFFPDVGIGLFAKTTIGTKSEVHTIYGGISMPQTFGFNVSFDGTGRSFDVKRVPHYYAFVGAYLYFSDDQYFLEPSIWFRSVLNDFYSIDVNLRYNIRDLLWIGLGYSINQSIHAEAGLILGEEWNWDYHIRIGYGFDNGYNPNYGASFGPSHEINLSFAF